MKNYLTLFLITIFISFYSCVTVEENDINDINVIKSEVLPTTATYQIQNGWTLFPITEYIDGSLWEVQVLFLNKNQLIGVDTIHKVPLMNNSGIYGTSEIYNVIPNCDVIKISWVFAPKESIYYKNIFNIRRYITEDFIPIKNANIIISISPNSKWTCIE